MLQKIVLIMAAGSVGTLARYSLAGWAQRMAGAGFPWGTFVVNMVGCFTVGLLWALFERRWAIPAETRTIVLVGFMGAFTTFSSYILESGLMLRTADWTGAVVYIGLQNFIGIAALMAGLAVANVF